MSRLLRQALIVSLVGNFRLTEQEINHIKRILASMWSRCSLCEEVRLLGMLSAKFLLTGPGSLFLTGITLGPHALVAEGLIH